MRKKRLYIRKWLNKAGHHSHGRVLIEVQDTSKDKEEWVRPGMTFEIADCSKQIRLEFGVGEEYNNSAHKINVLLDAITRFKEALEAEQALYLARVETAKAEVEVEVENEVYVSRMPVTKAELRETLTEMMEEFKAGVPPEKVGT